jgi:hypothetical protein
LSRRVERLERAAAAAEIRLALEVASDEAIARAALLQRRGKGEEANALLEGLGFTEALAELAVGSDADEEILQLRRGRLFVDVRSDPRWSRIKAVYERLRQEEGI